MKNNVKIVLAAAIAIALFLLVVRFFPQGTGGR